MRQHFYIYCFFINENKSHIVFSLSVFIETVDVSKVFYDALPTDRYSFTLRRPIAAHRTPKDTMKYWYLFLLVAEFSATHTTFSCFCQILWNPWYIRVSASETQEREETDMEQQSNFCHVKV